MKSSRINCLSEFKLSQLDSNALNWHELFGQFTSTIDSALLSDDEKLTYLNTLKTGKAKAAIAEYSFRVLNKDATATLQRKLGQPHTVVGAHSNILARSPPPKCVSRVMRIV